MPIVWTVLIDVAIMVLKYSSILRGKRKMQSVGMEFGLFCCGCVRSG